MPDLKDGQTIDMQGSGKTPYQLKNVGGVYTCTCPAWRNQKGVPPERRTCKHLRKLRGDDAESARVGAALAATPVTPPRMKDTAPDILLANYWDESIDPTGMWISEKLDGVRAYWTGEVFLSRPGNVFHAPDWFTKGLPGAPMDGELWIGRGQFQKTNGYVKRHDQGDHWREMKFVVFDLPKNPDPFEDRYRALQTYFNNRHCEFATYLTQVQCTSASDLKRRLQIAEAGGAEGLMLRAANSLYEIGRSNTLLKVVTDLRSEARVIGYKDGKGNRKGMVGSLNCILGDDVTFNVGSGLDHDMCKDPPAIGSIVSVKHKGWTEARKPRQPIYLGIRADATGITTPPVAK
jgi:DNA ligase 1